MSYIQGEGPRHQGTLFPVLLDDLVPGDQVSRVIDAFVNGLKMAALGFERAEAADRGRPGGGCSLKVTLYTGSEEVPDSASVRGRVEPDARADDSRSNEARPIYCRAFLCNDQVPYFRASSAADAWVGRKHESRSALPPWPTTSSG